MWRNTFVRKFIRPQGSSQSSVYEDKLKADPLNVILLLEYSQFLYNKLQFKETITVLLKILAIDENTSVATSLLYMAYMKAGKQNDAAEIGEKLLQRNPVDVNLLSDLADIAIQRNNDKEAFSYLERISGK